MKSPGGKLPGLFHSTGIAPDLRQPAGALQTQINEA
jgi:hypothetical protein